MNDNKYTSEDLKIMQSWPLERKIQVTQTRIIEWYQKNNGKFMYHFLAGKIQLFCWIWLEEFIQMFPQYLLTQDWNIQN